jgi:hypothetical protein
MSTGVAGRQTELAAIDEFLDAAQRGPVALVLEGEPGIGKTTLFQAATARAAERGATVLTARPTAAEARLAFVGFADLLAPVDEAIVDELPLPQRHALEVALLRADVGGVADRRTVSTAFLAIVRTLARARPLLLAIDDLQWLDRPSFAVLDFALRRLSTEPVGLLATRRPGAPPPFDATRVRVGPLSVAALHEVVKQHLGHAFARPTLVRIERVSGGNPFFALELARALLVRGDLSGPVEVPESLAGLLDERLRPLPARTRRALLVAAALAQPSVEHVESDALAPAEAAGVVRVGRRGAIEFTHPLLAAAVYDSASPAQRHEVHAELARSVADTEERARHLALAGDRPDEQVASALVEAAHAARRRGAPEATVELLELACARTPAEPAETLDARELELAWYVAELGDRRRAMSILRDLYERAHGATRTRAGYALAALTEAVEGGPAAVALIERVLAEAGDVTLRVEGHAMASRGCDHDIPRKLEHARSAVELLRSLTPAPELELAVLLAVADADFHAGRGIAEEALARADELEASRQQLGTAHLFPGLRASATLLSVFRLYADDLDRAREHFERERRIRIEHGGETWTWSLCRLATVELRAGNRELARQYVDELLGMVERTGEEQVQAWGLAVKADLDALAGDFDGGRVAAETALALAQPATSIPAAQAAAAAGFVELTAGDLAAARTHLDRVEQVELEIGLREPGVLRHHADRIEVLVALGELADAQAALARFAELARETGRTWALATSARCRALLLAARGEDATAAIEEALAEHERLPLPFERARTLLVERLFLSPKTVEANLARVYRKLGIGSRAELGARRHELGRQGNS